MKEAFYFLLMFMVVIGALQSVKAENTSWEKGPHAFGELEYQSWGLDLQPGAEQAFPIKIYMYKDSLEVLQKIGKKLLCPQFGKAYLFGMD